MLAVSTGQNIDSLGARFRTERERLGFSRPEFADAMKVSLGTVKNWEGGGSSPTADDLANFHEIGADVMYILTGQKVPENALDQCRADYELSPSKQLAAKVATMDLSAKDADLLLDFARRLSKPR